MLTHVAMLFAAIFLAAFLPLHRAMAVIGGCVLLVVYPVPSLVAIASMAAAYLFIKPLRRRNRNGVRRLPRSRS